MTVKYLPEEEQVRGIGPERWHIFYEVHHFPGIPCRHFPKTQYKAIALSQRHVKELAKQESLVQGKFHDFFLNTE